MSMQLSVTPSLGQVGVEVRCDGLFAAAVRSRRDVLMAALTDGAKSLEAVGWLLRDMWLADVHAGDMSEQTFRRYWQLSESYLRFAAARDCTTLDEAAAVFPEWLMARGRDRFGKSSPPGLSVRHLRACAVRALYRTARFLELTSAHLPYTSRETSVTQQGRPLNTVEASALRHVVGTDGSTRIAAAVALGLSGAGTVDIGNVRLQDINLSEGTIHLPGGGRTLSRIVAIPGEWERRVLTERISYQRAHGAAVSDGVVVRRNGSANSRQAGAAIAVTEATERAGLRMEGDIKPASLQRLAAMTAFDATGDVSLAACLLGTTSLDTAAQAIEWDWPYEPRPSGTLLPDYQPRVVR